MGLAKIHVYDEVQKIWKDFTCDVNILVGSLRYFKSHLAHITGDQDVEISVHCDIKIFSWLLNYANADSTKKPRVNAQNVLPILISSSFLQMHELVDECIDYVAEHLLEFSMLPGDLACLQSELLTKISKAAPEASLEHLHHVANQAAASANGTTSANQTALSSKLFKHKLESLMRSLRTTLVRCRVCGAIYSTAHAHVLSCSAASSKSSAADRGHAEASSSGASSQAARTAHTPDTRWRLHDHLAALRGSSSSSTRVNWRDIFWWSWGLVHVLCCGHCGQYFPLARLASCSYHPRTSVFDSGGQGSEGQGVYPCCSAPVGAGGLMHGCIPCDHQVFPPDPRPSGPPPSLTAALSALLRAESQAGSGPGKSSDTNKLVETLQTLIDFHALITSPNPSITAAHLFDSKPNGDGSNGVGASGGQPEGRGLQTQSEPSSPFRQRDNIHSTSRTDELASHHASRPQTPTKPTSSASPIVKHNSIQTSNGASARQSIDHNPTLDPSVSNSSLRSVMASSKFLTSSPSHHHSSSQQRSQPEATTPSKVLSWAQQDLKASSTPKDIVEDGGGDKPLTSTPLSNGSPAHVQVPFAPSLKHLPSAVFDPKRGLATHNALLRREMVQEDDLHRMEQLIMALVKLRAPEPPAVTAAAAAVISRVSTQRPSSAQRQQLRPSSAQRGPVPLRPGSGRSAGFMANQAPSPLLRPKSAPRTNAPTNFSRTAGYSQPSASPTAGLRTNTGRSTLLQRFREANA